MEKKQRKFAPVATSRLKAVKCCPAPGSLFASGLAGQSDHVLGITNLRPDPIERHNGKLIDTLRKISFPTYRYYFRKIQSKIDLCSLINELSIYTVK